jgi:hypothetical protein
MVMLKLRLDLSRPPGLVEPRLERTVEAQKANSSVLSDPQALWAGGQHSM